MADVGSSKRTAGMFKMRQLAKPEYKLLKALKDKYRLSDDAEVVTMCLRVTYEVLHMKDGHIADGEQWFKQLHRVLCTHSQEERIYEV